MSALKGQASMIDLLMLGLAISVLLVSTVYVGQQQSRAQTVREEAAYAQSMMNALMDYRNDTYGDYINDANFSFAETLNQYLCNGGGALQLGLGNVSAYFLNKTIKPGYDYIFITFYTDFSTAPPRNRSVYVWNKQESVCVDYITLSIFDLKLSCGNYNFTNDNTPPKIGIWPDWKPIPLANATKCTGGTPPTTS